MNDKPRAKPLVERDHDEQKDIALCGFCGAHRCDDRGTCDNCGETKRVPWGSLWSPE